MPFTSGHPMPNCLELSFNDNKNKPRDFNRPPFKRISIHKVSEKKEDIK
jgi:hypothetical protein